jgi:GH35 family endo-1,4-beta-xylanase
MKNKKTNPWSFATAKLQAKGRSLLAIIAFAAIIGFFVISCSNDSSNDNSNNNDNDNDNDNENTVYLHSKWPFKIGAAVNADVFSGSDDRYPLLGHFNALVAENEMKAGYIMPDQWQNWQSNPAYNVTQAYRWSEADKLVNYAEANNTEIRGHVLFWHEVTPEVFFRTGNKSSAYVSKEVFYQRMEQHVKTVFQKYRGRIHWWDVANETVGDDGNPREAGKLADYDGKSSFTSVMEASGVTGDDRYEWILKAFQYARKYADENGGQNVKLFLTEYNIEYSFSAAKLGGFLRLLDYLISNGAPIDGVGIQGHITLQDGAGYVSSLASTIDAITAKRNPVTNKNLVVQVCELDMSLFAWDDNRLELPAGEVTTRLQAQAAMYRNLFDMFAKKHSEGKLEMVLFWGIADGESWLNYHPKEGRTDHPLLFDRQYQPKPAFEKLITGPSDAGGGETGETGETVVSSHNAYAPYANLSNLSSSVSYQIVNLTDESRTNVMKVTNPGDWAVALYSLAAHKDTPIAITFSADVKRVGAAGGLFWQVNNSDNPFVGTPITDAAAGTWHTMSGTWTGTPTDDHPYLYLSTYQNNSASTTYYIDNFTITITP